MDEAALEAIKIMAPPGVGDLIVENLRKIETLELAVDELLDLVRRFQYDKKGKCRECGEPRCDHDESYSTVDCRVRYDIREIKENTGR